MKDSKKKAGECVHCGKPTKGNRKKYCSDGCKYWYNVIKKDNEKYMPPVSKRTDEYFSMVVGSQGSAHRGTSTVEEMVLITQENVIKHFQGIPGYYPNYMRLGNGETINRQDVLERFNIKLPE